ncbi:MAG: hypothetical protein H6817_08385 [Phycisphaerales bacterium]|nr:hypothetical protein [Phycisphaerales bacterium]
MKTLSKLLCVCAACGWAISTPVQGAVSGEILVWDELAENFGDLSEPISTTDFVNGFTANSNGFNIPSEFPVGQALNESSIAPYTSGVIDLINNVNSWLMDSSGGNLGCLNVIDLLPSDGFYVGLPPSCPGGGIEELSDGIPGTACQSVLRDYGRASLVVRYGFGSPTDIGQLRVFAGNFNNRDGRIFQHYDVYARQGDCLDGICPAHGSIETNLVGYEEFFPVVLGAKSGEFGMFNDNIWQGSLTQVLNFDSDILVEDCTDLRIVFYGAANITGVFQDPWQGYDNESPEYRDACSNGTSSMQEEEDLDGSRKAFIASVIKEIDIFEPLPTPVADIDYDDDIDLFDMAAMQRCFNNDVTTNGCYRYDVDASGAFTNSDFVAIEPQITGPQ